MSQDENANKKSSTENFTEMFRAFGKAVSEIFNDPELKEKAKEFTESAAEVVKTFSSRFKDEDVKDKYRDVGKAAEDFGRNIKAHFRRYKKSKNSDFQSDISPQNQN
jgi:hypothetical protein